jgi:type IV pilus assembly protein PilQ
LLRKVADLYDINLVIPESLQGRASLKLSDVTWQQVFDVLLPPMGYGYREDGVIVLIESKSHAKSVPDGSDAVPPELLKMLGQGNPPR